MGAVASPWGCAAIGYCRTVAGLRSPESVALPSFRALLPGATVVFPQGLRFLRGAGVVLASLRPGLRRPIDAARSRADVTLPVLAIVHFDFILVGIIGVPGVFS